MAAFKVSSATMLGPTDILPVLGMRMPFARLIVSASARLQATTR